jgi:5-hydroxyisourate hydrolase
MTAISTHVLDTAAGHPAAGIDVSLQKRGTSGHWQTLGRATTSADGRASGLAGPDGAEPGVHRLVFAAAGQAGAEAFFPEVIVTFRVAGEDHLHIPLLLSPYGYTVYRGS